jgi:hypothetical protein
MGYVVKLTTVTNSSIISVWPVRLDVRNGIMSQFKMESADLGDELISLYFLLIWDFVGFGG